MRATWELLLETFDETLDNVAIKDYIEFVPTVTLYKDNTHSRPYTAELLYTIEDNTYVSQYKVTSYEGYEEALIELIIKWLKQKEVYRYQSIVSNLKALVSKIIQE